MISNTSKDLRKELDGVTVYGIELRRFLEKILNRMTELEDMIAEKQDKEYESDE